MYPETPPAHSSLARIFLMHYPAMATLLTGLIEEQYILFISANEHSNFTVASAHS